MGAVTGDHSFLKIVTNATARPPIAPTMIQGPATEGSSAVRTCAHTHAAGRTTKNNRNAVRFTVPSTSGRDSTCASKPWLLVRWSAVLQFKVVLEVLAADRGQRRWDLAGGEPADVGALRRCSPRHVSSRGSAPSPEAPDVVVQHQELLEHRHALAFAAELGEQLA